MNNTIAGTNGILNKSEPILALWSFLFPQVDAKNSSLGQKGNAPSISTEPPRSAVAFPHAAAPQIG